MSRSSLFLLAISALFAVATATAGEVAQSEPFELSSRDHAVMVLVKTEQTFGAIVTVANRLWLSSGLELRFIGEGESPVVTECVSRSRQAAGRKSRLLLAQEVSCLMTTDQARALARLPKVRLELRGRASLASDERKTLFEAKIRKKHLREIARFVSSVLAD